MTRSASSGLITAAILSACLSAQTPFQLKYECSPSDSESFGLPCAEGRPCQVFLEISSVDAAGGTLFAVGNLHTEDITLYGVVLASEDRGITWTEPVARVRASALEQVEFFDGKTGWASGESVDPLSRNPFMLLTTDGGKTWRQRPMFDDTKYGAITQFHFASASSGELLLDASRGNQTRQELYGSETGGESWELKETGTKSIHLHSAKSAGWRVRPDAPTKTLRIEHLNGRVWEPVASFAIHVADCQ